MGWWGTAVTHTSQEPTAFLESSFSYHFQGLLRAGLDDLVQFAHVISFLILFFVVVVKKFFFLTFIFF